MDESRPCAGGAIVTARPNVIVVESLDGDALERLRLRCDVATFAAGAPLPDDALADARGLVVRTATIVDDALLDRAPRLRVVGRAGVGLDNVDVAACRARGIDVVYTPDANTQAVVEFVFAILLAHLRPIHRLPGPTDVAAWNTLRRSTVGRRELGGMTLGILGLGRIGRRVARAAAGLGMTVVYHDLREIDERHRFGARPVDAEMLCRVSDVITIHVDGRRRNRGLVDAKFLAQCRHDVVIVNTSRGFVVDDHALAAFLAEHPAASALIDVHEPEPIAEGAPLLEQPNAELTPHLASRTTAGLAAMSAVVDDVLAVLDGHAPRWPAPEPQ